jgi:hypothetical protein
MGRRTNAVVVLVALALAVPAAQSAQRREAACTPKFAGGVLHLCGPASARVSVFRGVIFRNGTCKRQVVAGEPTLTLELGQLVPGSKTNGGRAYLKLIVSGPLARPTGGLVLAYYKSKRWSGTGKSFKGTARRGSFVAVGTPPSRGTATGSFRCTK